ncbi:MAG: helix-turn-helix domain-containing protein [Anaerovoracaceae bacterium]|jgi:transcriptional regulator with XRE-family HTH domain
MKADTKDMGARIRTARIRKELTQEELAEMIGASDTYISRIENGRGTPSLDLVVDIMNALELSPNELFCGIVESAKPNLLMETADLLNKFSAERISVFNQQMELELREREKWQKEMKEKGSR